MGKSHLAHLSVFNLLSSDSLRSSSFRDDQVTMSDRSDGARADAAQDSTDRLCA